MWRSAASTNLQELIQCTLKPSNHNLPTPETIHSRNKAQSNRRQTWALMILWCKPLEVQLSGKIWRQGSGLAHLKQACSLKDLQLATKVSNKSSLRLSIGITGTSLGISNDLRATGWRSTGKTFSKIQWVRGNGISLASKTKLYSGTPQEPRNSTYLATLIITKSKSLWERSLQPS